MKKLKITKTAQPLLFTILVFIALVAGFGGGVAFQKGKTPTMTPAANNRGFAAGPGGQVGQGRGTFGTVKAITDTSITVADRRSSSDTTYTLTSSTTVTSNGTSGSISDIKTGDTVLLRLASSGNTTVSQIVLNPSMPQGPNDAPGAMQSSTTSDTSATSSI